MGRELNNKEFSYRLDKKDMNPDTVNITQVNDLLVDFKRVRMRTVRLIKEIPHDFALSYLHNGIGSIKQCLARILYCYEYHFSSWQRKRWESLDSLNLCMGQDELLQPNLLQLLEYSELITKKIYSMLIAVYSQKKERELTDLLLFVLNIESYYYEKIITILKLLSMQNNRPFDQFTDEYKVPKEQSASRWLNIEAGLFAIGSSEAESSFDVEKPRHNIYLERFSIATDLVTNGEYLEFVEAGGYYQDHLWFDEGNFYKQGSQVIHPIYWKKDKNYWYEYSIDKGFVLLDVNNPIMHINYYEASAFAHWKKMRLPTEQQMEVAMSHSEANEMNHHLWSWTDSSFTGYPGAMFNNTHFFYPMRRADLMVLRGGSFVSDQKIKRKSFRARARPYHSHYLAGIRLVK